MLQERRRKNDKEISQFERDLLRELDYSFSRVNPKLQKSIKQKQRKARQREILNSLESALF
jgi:hypothetical protein